MSQRQNASNTPALIAVSLAPAYLGDCVCVIDDVRVVVFVVVVGMLCGSFVRIHSFILL